MIIKGYEVWLQLGPERLPEYSTSISGKTITCFVPAEEGKTFSVHWKDQTRGKSFTGPTLSTVKIDGRRFDEGICTYGNRKNDSQGFRETADSFRPYRFEAIRSSRFARVMPHNDLGSIRVEVNKIEKPSYAGFPPQDSMPAAKALSETSVPNNLKLCVGLGGVREFKSNRRFPTCTLKTGAYGADPYLSFLFKYREPGVLHSEGHITMAELGKYNKQVEAYQNHLSKTEPREPSGGDEIEEFGDELEAKVDQAARLLGDIQRELAKRRNNAPGTSSGQKRSRLW